MASYIKVIRNNINIIAKDPIPGINVYCDDSNILIWYFLVFGKHDSDYKGGEYIGKITFDTRYPYTPPEFYMETPNGRFDVGKKICLSNSKFHMSEWRPTWTIQSIINAFVSVMYEDTDKGISHIKMAPEERRKLANKSVEWNVKHMSSVYDNLKNNYVGKTDDDKKQDSNKKETSLLPPSTKIDMDEINKLIRKTQKQAERFEKQHKETNKLIKDFENKRKK